MVGGPVLSFAAAVCTLSGHKPLSSKGISEPSLMNSLGSTVSFLVKDAQEQFLRSLGSIFQTSHAMNVASTPLIC